MSVNPKRKLVFPQEVALLMLWPDIVLQIQFPKLEPFHRWSLLSLVCPTQEDVQVKGWNTRESEIPDSVEGFQITWMFQGIITEEDL